MNLFISGILRMLLLEASAALRLFVPAGDARRRRYGLGLALCAAFLFTNCGQLHGDGHLVHAWEQMHFFLGSKYLRELGYFDLYKATLLADREGVHVLDGVTQTRDLTTFDLQPVAVALQDGPRVRARFSDARWKEFVADWRNLSRWDARWSDVVADHGNSGSPAWALFALPLVRVCGSSRLGQVLIGFADLLLMVILFAAVYATFGIETASLGLLFWSVAPFVFDYLGGSILRWDWLFALGFSLCFWKRERPFAAGAALGYAVVSKLFPICFAVALGAWLVFASLRARRLHPALPRLVLGAALSALIFVAASSLVFGGFGIWRGYAERISVAQHELFYPNQYSFKTVWLQLRSPGGIVFPAYLEQATDALHTHGLLAAQLVLTALVLAALARASDLEAFYAGPFLVLIWLTVNAYYWNMLGLAAIGLTTARRNWALLALHAAFGAFFLYQHLNLRYAECYFLALLLVATGLVWIAQTLLRTGRQ